MLKSVFSRVFLICFATTLIILILVAALVSGTLRRTYINDKFSDMRSSVSEISRFGDRRLEGDITLAGFYRWLGEFSQREKSTIIITDTDMNVQLISDQTGKVSVTNSKLNAGFSDMFLKTKEGDTVSIIATMEGVSSLPVMLIAAPLTVDNVYSGAIFMYSEIKYLNESLDIIRTQVINCVLISLAIAGHHGIYFFQLRNERHQKDCHRSQ